MTYHDRLADLIQRAGPNLNAMLTDLNPNRRATQILERTAAVKFAAGWRADPFTMARHLDPESVLDWKSSRYLAEKWVQAHTGQSRFQVWNMPTQTVGKSTWLRYGILWSLDRAPAGSMIYLCHSARLAREGAIFVRDRARKHRDELAFTLSPDLQQQGHWKTTQGGQLLATYLGGASGFPASIGVVIDDPLANWQEAHSVARRDHVDHEIKLVARMRLAETAFMILSHTRLHKDDPTGRMRQLQEETGIRIDHVVLPMIAKDDDPLGREPGQPLERFSLEEATARRTFVGSYLAAAMEDQDPIEDVGGELQRAWWRHTDNPPRHSTQAVTSWDMKLKDKQSGDYVVGLAMCRVGADFFVLDQIRGQFSFLQTKCAIALMHLRYPWIHKHVVENTGNGPEVIQQLREGDEAFAMTDAIRAAIGATFDEAVAVQEIVRLGLVGVIAETPKHSKIVRARTYTPLLENGNVWLPVDAPWVPGFVDEAAGFPPKAGGHDDRVDAWSQGMKHLDRQQAQVYKPTTPTPAANPAGAAKAMPQGASTRSASSRRGNARVFR